MGCIVDEMYSDRSFTKYVCAYICMYSSKIIFQRISRGILFNQNFGSAFDEEEPVSAVRELKFSTKVSSR